MDAILTAQNQELLLCVIEARLHGAIFSRTLAQNLQVNLVRPEVPAAEASLVNVVYVVDRVCWYTNLHADVLQSTRLLNISRRICSLPLSRSKLFFVSSPPLGRPRMPYNLCST